MNSVNFKTVKSFTKSFLKFNLFVFCFFAQVKVHADAEIAAPVSETKSVEVSRNLIVKPSDKSEKQRDADLVQAIRKAVQPAEPTNEIVILNTESGFIPDKVRVKKGVAYKVHVVNLNMKEKNVSFLMDSFTQSHNTIFGVRKTFNIEPQVEGIYSYQCPETGVQGQLIVAEPPQTLHKRKLANYSEDEE